MTDTLPGGPVDGTPADPPDPLFGGLAGPPAGRAEDTPAAAAPPPPPPASMVAAPTPRRETVTCPECGTTSDVTLTRREAADFCPRCDFPLFWTPATIQLGDQETAGETLRRLPGTAGRTTVAAVPCPHCSEANPIAALTCVRCGLPMAAPPPPVHVAPPPLPAPVPVPVKRTPWWVWVALALTAVVLAALVAWFALDRWA